MRGRTAFDETYAMVKRLFVGAWRRDELAAPQYLEDHRKLLARLEAEPRLYGKVQVTKFNAGRHDIAPPGTADFVLTFRNLHNWIERDEVEGALRAFHRALKPGAVLGVVDHRGRADLTQQAQMKSADAKSSIDCVARSMAAFRFRQVFNASSTYARSVGC